MTFNPLEAYEQERAENRRLFGLLNTALLMLEGNQHKIGENATQKAFIERLRKERFRP